MLSLFSFSRFVSSSACILLRLIIYIFCFVVGASADPGGVTMIDSIKIYVKTKESFGWPEESDEFPESSVTKALQQPGVVTVTESETVSFAPLPLTCADRLVTVWIDNYTAFT